MKPHAAHEPSRFGGFFRRVSWLPFLAILAPSALADYAGDWGPEPGSQIPMLEAYDQDGNLRTLDSLAGEHGLLLFLNRSADW